MFGISSVTLFRGYPHDNRRSMEIYSRHLIAGLRAKLPAARIREVVPRSPAWAGRNDHAMRVFRYVVYPWQARSKHGQINHITEAGYAHLVRRLNPDKTIVTVHDLIPLLSWRGLIPGLTYPHSPRLFEHSISHLRNCAAVVVPSQCIRNDVIRHCGCRAGNVHVVRHGIDRRFRPFLREERREQRRRLRLPVEDPLILICGDEPYKNHDTCIRVLHRVRRRLPRAMLVRVGKRRRPTAAQEAASERTILDLGDFEPEAMPAVYNAVDLLLFPSWYEGFGWPPLEAMACGVPVVASSAGSIPEVVGDAAYLCSPDDDSALAERVCQVLEDAPARPRIIEKGLHRAKEFSWDRNVDRICNLYAEILLRGVAPATEGQRAGLFLSDPGDVH
jgi:glycosyltransferase involved in cell wall biosynthesis